MVQQSRGLSLWRASAGPEPTCACPTVLAASSGDSGLAGSLRMTSSTHVCRAIMERYLAPAETYMIPTSPRSNFNGAFDH